MDNNLLVKFEEWLALYCKDRNPTKNTIRSIRSTMTRFLAYCQEKGIASLNDINRTDVIEWLNSLVDARTSTRKAAERNVVLFFNRALAYGMREAMISQIGYRGPADVPRSVIKGFTLEERKTMMQNTKKLDNRERVIYYLLSQRPMRQSELLKFKVEDVNLQDKTITIYKSKNHSSRIIGIPHEAYDAMVELVREKEPGDFVFGMSERTMGLFINGIIERLGVKRNGRSSHAFRHTVIVEMLRGLKLDPAVIAEIAGNSPKTIYEHYNKNITTDELRYAEQQMDMMARGRNTTRNKNMRELRV